MLVERRPGGVLAGKATRYCGFTQRTPTPERAREGPGADVAVVFALVDDVEAHAERARAAGARVLGEPEDSPRGRLYRVEDPEGNRWMFEQRS